MPVTDRSTHTSVALGLPVYVQRLAEAVRSYPESFQGQQEHFAKTLPRLERELEEALCFLFSRSERIALLGVLHDLHGDELEGEGDDEG